MIELKKSTKKAQAMIETHKRATARSIFEAYKKPSGAKVSAYESCLRMCSTVDGVNFRVHSAGCFTFCVSFRTGNDLVYITPTYEYLIKGAFVNDGSDSQI